MQLPEVLDDARHGVDWATVGARVGYAGKALLYAALGVLIGQLALRGGNEDTSATGAIEAIARQPFGTVLLLLLAAGLISHGTHAAWSMLRGDEDGFGRVSCGARALVYLGLGALAIGKAIGAGGSGSSGQSESTITAELLSWPGGPWIVAAAGLGIIVAGGAKLYRAVTARWQDEFERHDLSPTEHTFMRRTGRVGHLARAGAYGLVGGFVVYAAVTHDPQKSGGLDAALGEVTRSPIAPYVLAPLAAGMLAYAIFAAMMARYAVGD